MLLSEGHVFLSEQNFCGLFGFVLVFFFEGVTVQCWQNIIDLRHWQMETRQSRGKRARGEMKVSHSSVLC